MNTNNFNYLLVALLTFLFGIPLFEDFALMPAPWARAFLFSVLLVVGVWSLKGSGRFLTVGMTFVAAGVLLNILAVNIASAALFVGALAAVFSFLLTAIAYTFKQVAFGTEITFNRLVGAVCVYLLLGALWAIAYSMIESVAPGSFVGFTPHHGDAWDSEWLYFSFVTMTTLGYGDILPVSAIARSLAYMQALIGQFYIAILVAGLVGGYIARRQTQRNDA